MARFEVRLEAQDGSGHFRETTINGKGLTEEEARAFCEERELRIVHYTLSPGEQEHADRAQILMHRQDKPYKIVSVRKA